MDLQLEGACRRGSAWNWTRESGECFELAVLVGYLTILEPKASYKDEEKLCIQIPLVNFIRCALVEPFIDRFAAGGCV